jgi:molecular chaperone HscA
MDLLDICEPEEQLVETSTDENNIAIGIDLGTTNSVVSYFDGSNTIIIGEIISSTIMIENNQIIIGSNKKNAFRSVKRLMGKNFDDIKHNQFLDKNIKADANGDLFITLDDINMTAEEISAHILIKLKNQAEEFFGHEISKAVITVPAYFDERAKNATKNAAKLANIEVLRLLNEPTAAAVSYGLDEQKLGTYIIYDLGGGTFDISIIKLFNGVFKVIATTGNSEFGGDDIDIEIAKYLSTKYNLTNKTTELKLIAKKIKEELSNQLQISLDFEEKSLSLTQDELISICTPLFKQSFKLLDQCIFDAQIEESEIKGLVMVGGSTKMPLLNILLKKYYDFEIFNHINPDEIVANGAAIQAYNLTHKTNNLLIDILPLSLGIETMGGIFEKIVAKNTIIPCSISKEFTTYKNGQQKMLIHILQGERDLVKDCRSLAKIILHDIKPALAGQAKIKISFNIDSDGLLTVEALNADNNQTYSTEIKPSFGLSNDVVTKMIEESYQFAKQDIEDKRLLQSRIDADKLLLHMIDIIKQDADLFIDNEEREITNAINILQASMQNDNYDDIENNLIALNKIAENFIDRRTNFHLKNQLLSREISDFDN